MGAGVLGKVIESAASALGLRNRRAEIHQLPDRKLLRDVYIPAFAEQGGRILFVGCRGYNKGYYAILESRGAELWTTDIDPRSGRFGHGKRHRVGDICEADTLFGDLMFDGILCNGVLGYGVDSREQQDRAIAALSKILKPQGTLLVGWNTDKIEDPVVAGRFAVAFAQTPFAGQPPRVRFDGVTHVYDTFVRKP